MDSKTDLPPHRPLIPKKPDKDKISLTSSPPPPHPAGSGSESLLKKNSIDSSTLNSIADARKSFFNGSQQATEQQETSNPPPPIPPTKPGLTSSFSSPPSSSSKPALPPKPTQQNLNSPSRNSFTSSPPSSLTSPPPTKPTNKISPPPPSLLPKGRNSLSIANAILANKNGNNITTKPPCQNPPPPQQTFHETNITHRSIRSPSAPLSPRPASNNNSQPPRPFSSVFHFPVQHHQEQSPSCQNLNPSPTRTNSSFPPPGKSLRAGKSASLGRNFAPPTSPTSSVGQFFSNKAATLARMLPLDLNFGKSQQTNTPKSPTTPTPTTNSIPTLIQNFNNHISSSQQQHRHQQNVSFSNNNGPIPPPPPPRLRRKLSPIGSLSPVSDSSPNSPPEVFSANSPPMMTSSGEERRESIYAEIDKEKKWAARRLKQSETNESTISFEKVENKQVDEEEDGIQASLVITINRDSSDCKKLVNVQSVSCDEVLNNDQCKKDVKIEPVVKQTSQCSTQQRNAEAIVVDSWLGKFLTGPVTGNSNLNPPKMDNDDDNSIRLHSPLPNDQPKLCDYDDHTLESNSISVDQLTQSTTTMMTMLNQQESVNSSLVDNMSFLFSHLSTVGGDDCRVDEANTSKNADKILPPMTTTNSQISQQQQQPSDPDSLLMSVDSKIQSVVNRLSNLSGKVSPSGSHQSSDSPPPPPAPITEEYESLSITEGGDQNPPKVTNQENITKIEPSNLSTTTASSLVRRKSWNCSQEDSSSPCDSSSSSLTNLKTSNFSPKKKVSLGWVDEGDSTGVLGDVDTCSDAAPTQNNDSSSVEDVAGSTFSLKRRTMRLFSSFGKAGSSSGSGGGGSIPKQKQRKDSKTKSLLSDNKGGKNMSRQISGPILSTPPTPTSVTFSQSPHKEARESPSKLTREKSRSHPTVQFSPEVLNTPTTTTPTTTSSTTTPHHHTHHRLSEGSIGSPPGRRSLQMPESEQGDDDESISSFGSISTIGTGCYNLNFSNNSAGYEDILSELSPQDRKAFYVAREILTSEQTFIDVLDLLTIDFPNAVRRYEETLKHPIIPPQDLDGILAGLPNLKRVNEELQTDLQARISNWLDKPKLSDVFITKGPFLKLYAHYIKNFEKTTAKLDECCGMYPPFKKAVQEFEQSDRCHLLGLKHFMLKPVQRMPQYRLLLSDYLKNQEETGCDYEDTVKALAIVKDVAEHANEAIKLQVNSDKLLHLQNRLTGAIIMKSDRQLLKEGELTKVCRKDLQPRFIALMNDCLMCMSYNYNVGASGGGSGSSKDLKMRHELPLTGMRICLSASDDYQNEFTVISTARSFNLVAKSPREREEWMKALNDAVNDNIRKRTCRTPDQEEGFALGKIAPVWIQDGRVTMCQICTAEFTVTFRRHHCRSCGKVVCRHCSGNEAPLLYRKNDAERVCDECYQYLLEEFDKESATNDGLETSRETIRARFKKVTPNISNRRKRNGKSGILEVPANNSGSRISGYLHCRERKAWKRRWFVLMDRVLYIYAASEDIVAIKSFPVLGWNVDYEKTECMDGGDSEAVFKLTHLGQPTLLFQADNSALAERWINLMKEATVLT